MEVLNIRAAFSKKLIEMARHDKAIVVIDPDVCDPMAMRPFLEAYPNRFYQMGIAEQNAFGVAAGLASTGVKSYVAAFAVFTSMRGCEMIRTTICYPHHNVKILGGYAGLSNGKDGATHHSIEDIAICRSFPNMTVIACTDSVYAAWAAEISTKFVGPMYIRMEFEELPPIYDKGTAFELGKAKVIRKGSDITLVSFGTAAYRTMEAASELSRMGVQAEVIDMHTIKPFDKTTLVESVKKTRALVTLEEHNIFGGLSELCCEALVEAGVSATYKRLGIKDVYTESGNTNELRARYGIDAKAVVSEAQKALKSKGET
jgi:transketolase